VTITVRQMTLAEGDLIMDYFHGASREHLEMLGVDPTRLPNRDAWRRRVEEELGLPLERRGMLLVIWRQDDQPVGFSIADRIVHGDRANMHLHIIDPACRSIGIGTQCVCESVDLYFDALKLKQLFCEPNAFNTAPNRTLQKAGFRYLKTHMTVPGPLNFHQAVTQWVTER
jgi:RimJ/RimL family protein N-acetyltransferase